MLEVIAPRIERAGRRTRSTKRVGRGPKAFVLQHRFDVQYGLHTAKTHSEVFDANAVIVDFDDVDE